MFLYKNKIVVTGGSGRFGSQLKKVKNRFNLIYPNKSQLNILNYNKIKKYLKKHKPKYLIHLAGLSRPMKIHEKLVNKSIDLNIIGTMCLPPENQDSDNFFSEMKNLNNNLNLNELSMGMSHDYINAIEHSATYIRIGSKIFGERG